MVVYPAASLPYLAVRSGATVVEINPDQTPFTDQATFVLPGPAGVVLPQLLASLGALSQA
jgi:NAD-dependent deacetylase